jgi:hypothetical protein
LADREAEAKCGDNLRTLAIAIQHYHDRFGSFPPAYMKGKDGRPAHSWRVLILPFLGRKDLYDAYHFDEPWDGPNNARLAEQMPNVFACPGNRRGPPGRTSYVAVIGSQTIWPGDRAVSHHEVTDGTSNTILLIEIADSDIAWTEPRDVLMRELIPPGEDGVGPRFGSAHRDVINCAFADCSVRRIQKPFQGENARKVLRSALTAFGGRPFRGEWVPGEAPEKEGDVLVGAFPPETDAGRLLATDVTPHLEGPIASGRNYVYCATFQIAWDDLRRQLRAAPQVQGDPVIAAALNRTTFPRAALSPESFVARMGFVSKGIHEEIRQEMARKFPGVTPSFTAPAGQTDVIAYAFLQKNLPFAAKFDVLPEPLAFHAAAGKVRVKSFGFKELASASGLIDTLKK